MRSADVQAGVPDAVAAELLAPAEAAEDAAPVAAEVALEALALEAPDGELPAAVVDVDDAAHPAASTPAASSGTTSSAFFTRLPSGWGTNEVSQCSVTDL